MSTLLLFCLLAFIRSPEYNMVREPECERGFFMEKENSVSQSTRSIPSASLQRRQRYDFIWQQLDHRFQQNGIHSGMRP